MIAAKTTVFNANWIDIVFEGRNQDYGAYELRKQGEKNLVLSVFYTLLFFVTGIAIPTVVNYLYKANVPVKVVNVPEDHLFTAVRTIVLQAPKPAALVPPAPRVKAPAALSIPVVKPTDDMNTNVPPVTDIKGAANPVDVGTGTNTGSNTSAPPLDLAVPMDGDDISRPLRIVEVPPEFPGGEAGRIKFVQEHITYPRIAVDGNIQGTVYVQFIITPEGKVSDAKIVKGIGAGCDEEALRVMRMMPAWKPGKQNGRTVFVQYCMPIKFTLRN